MAKLSTRVEEPEYDDLTTKIHREIQTEIQNWLDEGIELETNILQNTTQENANMNNALRELTVTLIDNNINLEDDQRIVFKKKEFITSASDEDVKLELIATGEVMPALMVHNTKVRATTIREDIQENTGREVMLKPVKKLSDPQLEWRFVATA